MNERFDPALKLWVPGERRVRIATLAERRQVERGLRMGYLCGGGVAGGGSGPANVKFHSAWNYGGLGGTVANLTDVGNPLLPWDGVLNNAPAILNVVLGIGLPNGRPAPPDGILSVLQTKRLAGSSDVGFCSIGVNSVGADTPKWAQLADGEIIRWRFYSMMDIPNAEGDKSGDSNHPVQIPSGTSSFCNLKSNSPMADGTQTWATGAVQQPFPTDVWCLGTFNGVTFWGQQIPKFVWYRHEYSWARIDATHYTMEHRIYDAAGGLMWSPDGVGASGGAIKNVTGGAQITQASFAGQFLAPPNQNYTQSFACGHNGGTAFTTLCYYYWAAVCICQGPTISTPLIGAYNPITGI